jgi:hypothetical protein
MDRNDPLKHSRHKRMPKVWRMGQDAPKAIDSLGDEFRVTIYLTNAQADRAEREAINTGMGDLQGWCQATLRRIINQLDDDGGSFGNMPVIRTRQPSIGPEIVAELDIPDDPDFYSELAGIGDEHAETAALPAPSDSKLITKPEQPGPIDPSNVLLVIDESTFASALDQIMTSLRAGRRPADSDVATVCSRLEKLAEQTGNEQTLSRKLIRPLYRLAMESQVLITEVHPRLGLDLTVVTQVRRLQAAVGRILDI